MAKTSQVERQARAFCIELARVTGGRLMHWRTVEAIGAGIVLDDASAAIAYGVERDWLLTEGPPPHSVCLTDAGRIMAAKHRPRARR